MRVVITGGQGFIGRRLVDAILDQGLVDAFGDRVAVDDVVLVDVVAGSAHDDVRVSSTVADLSSGEPFIEILGDGDDVSVFHLASMVSAESELDWSRAVATNIGGLIGLIEAAQARSGPTKVVFASSVAVFGGPVVADGVNDHTKQMPQSTYGMTKSVGEMMINDATRKDILDGRCARLPTVVVRPGKPNRAASGFFSGLFREPLKGERSVVPVGGDVGVIMIGPRCAVDGLMALHDLPSETLGLDRAVPLPGLEVTVAEMIEVLGVVGGATAVSLLDHVSDSDIERVVTGWPRKWDDTRGRQLGLPADESLLGVVREHLSER